MSKKRSILLLTLVALVASFGGFLLSRLYDVQTVQAQQAIRQESVTGKLPPWEYCAVYVGSGSAKNKRTIAYVTTYYFQSAGCKREDIQLEGEPSVFLDAMSRAIGKLGEEGWQIIEVSGCEGCSLQGKFIYFQRPKI